MELKLIKKDDSMKSLPTNRFLFFKNMIKKDLELSYWCNKAIKAFGEFEIYSDFKADLNSFDNIVSFETNSVIEFDENSISFHVSSQCINCFFNSLNMEEERLSILNIDVLASQLTNYLIESIDIINSNSQENARLKILVLDKEYFNENILLTKTIK